MLQTVLHAHLVKTIRYQILDVHLEPLGEHFVLTHLAAALLSQMFMEDASQFPLPSQFVELAVLHGTDRPALMGKGS
jgi:hypothetical protein